MSSGDQPPDQGLPFRQRFELVRRLAKGGMAEVLLARPLPAIGQEPVVVKRILPELAAQPQFVQMFLHEARIAALLRHPNIVRTFEFGTADEAYFIAMEYLDGITAHDLLQGWLRRGQPVPYAHAIAIVREVCAGLHYAHELCDEEGRPMQLVHRDVSPQNVVVTREGGVKLLDFGIAKSLAARTSTGNEQMKGKLRYLSPEQCRGECDRRSDVFAAGLILYELTVGRRAYRAPTEAELMTRVLMARFDRPTVLLPRFPPPLEHVILRALAKAPADRYPTAAALREALGEVAATTGNTAAPGSLAAMVVELQAEARVLAQVTASPPPSLELAIPGTVEIDDEAATTDVGPPDAFTD